MHAAPNKMIWVRQAPPLTAWAAPRLTPASPLHVQDLKTDFPSAPDPTVFHKISGTGNAPWEIKTAQPVIVELVEQGAFDGAEVLDVGCCMGDHSIYIAKHSKGSRVTAFDFVPRAVEVARQRAAEAAVNVEFHQADATDISNSSLASRQFDVVLDSFIYHCFGEEDCAKYVAGLGQLVRPGGKYYQLVFSEHEPPGPGPRHISKQEIDETFNQASGWKVEGTKEVAGLSKVPEDEQTKQIIFDASNFPEFPEGEGLWTFKAYRTTITRL